MTVFPALCRRCKVNPAQGYWNKQRSKFRLHLCVNCSIVAVRDSRARKKQERATWETELNQWREQS